MSSNRFVYFRKMTLNKIIILLLSITFIISCQEDETIVLDEVIPEAPKNYSLEFDFSNEYPIGHDLGLNFFNDITVGVISYTANEVQLITAASTSSYILSGNSISDLTESSQVAAPEPNTFYKNYVGLGQLIIDPQGIMYSVFHAEEHDGSILPGNIPGFYASIGLGISYDNGASFELMDEPIIQNIYDINYDNGYGDGGLGEPSITYSKDSTEVYVYYVDHNRTGRGVNICMAKFNVLSDGSPDFSTCYFLDNNNEFTPSTIRAKEVVSGIGFSDAIFPQVTYNAFIEKYIMVYSLNHYGEFHNGTVAPVESGIYYKLSEDGISWINPSEKIVTGWSIPFSYDNHSYIWHPNLVYSEPDQSKGHLIFSKAATLQEGHKMWAIDFQFIEN